MVHGRETALYGNIILKMGVIAEPSSQEQVAAAKSWMLPTFLPEIFLPPFYYSREIKLKTKTLKTFHHVKWSELNGIE